MIADDSHRAGRNRRVDEARAIGLGAGEREEQIARLHHTAVDGEPRDVDRLGLRIDRGVVAEEVAKLHLVPVEETRRKAAADRSKRLNNGG